MASICTDTKHSRLVVNVQLQVELYLVILPSYLEWRIQYNDTHVVTFRLSMAAAVSQSCESDMFTAIY